MIFGRWRVPDWSAFGDRRTHDQFLEVVRAQLREADVAVDEDDQGPVLDLGDGASLDVAELSTAAVDVAPDTWDDLARGRIASATNPYRAPSDPARLEPAVRVRLMTVEALGRFPKMLPHRRHADLAEVLVIDSARSLVWADEADLEPLGRGTDELFALGHENVRRGGPPRTSELVVDGATITLADGRGDETSSWALMLDQLLDVPEAGVAVAVPTRAQLLAAPLAGDDGVDADVITAMAAAAAERHDAGPGRISPGLYRWREGDLTLLT